MPRRSGIWPRKDRGWYCYHHGRQIALGHDRQAAEQEFHRLKSQDAPAQPGRATVRDLVDRYRRWAAERVRANTYDLYHKSLEDWIGLHGPRRAADIRPFHVTDWLDRHKGWNGSTRHLRATIVKIWSAWATEQGHLDVDRLRGMRLPGIAKRQPASRESIEAMIAVSEGEFRDFVVVLFDTGCRPGEIRALESAFLDLKVSTARVHGKAGERVIGLTARAVEILRRNAATHPEGALLRAPNGRPWALTSLRNYFGRACKAAGVEHVCPYDLRHRFWERAIEGGADSVAIARQLGHTDLSMITNRYSHPTAAQLCAVVSAADSIRSRVAEAREQMKAENTPAAQTK